MINTARMITSTSYGNWANWVDLTNSVEQSVHEAFGSDGADGYDVDTTVSEYRAAINAALPAGVSLNGDDFLGPYHPEDCDFDGYPQTQDGSLDISAIIQGIDLWAIICQHQA